VRVSDERIDEGDSTVSPLTIALILLAATVTLCALVAGLLFLAKARRRRRAQARAREDLLVTSVTPLALKKGEPGDEALPRSGSGRGRSRRSSQSRSAAGVSTEYATMPTIGADSTVSSDYRPMVVSPRRGGQGGGDYRPMSVSPAGGGDYGTIESLTTKEGRTHGYGVPDEGLVSRSHGYAQTDTAYADISTRRSQVGEASKYATGELG
jgi:hypothetical protein